MSMLINVKVPASFIVGWGFPTGAELGYGFRHGWVGRRCLVDVAVAKYKANLPLVPAEEELALLLADEVEKVDELAGTLEISDQPVERRSRYWALLALAWLLEHESDYSDPLALIDMLYADFEYFEEIAPLVGYTPLAPDDAPGTAGIRQRWVDSVERWRVEHRERDQASSATNL